MSSENNSLNSLICKIYSQEEVEEEGEPTGPVEPLVGDDVEMKEGEQQPPDKPRKTTRYMTKYERARVLGTRALQIRYFE